MIVYVNAAGCTNACRHCAPGGHPPYGSFYTLAELREIVREWGPVWPYYEATAHPEFPEILDPQIVGEGCNFPPTNGFGLADREDYREVFTRMRDLGCVGVSFTLHGLENYHDWFACRSGAFQTIMKASRRAAEMGFNAHWNVFVDRRNAGDIPDLLELGRRELGKTSFWLGFADPTVSHRGLLYEKIRPRLRDVQELLKNLDPGMLSGPIKDMMQEEHTESALLQAWGEDPGSEKLLTWWEPKTWPPGPEFDNGFIRIESSRKVFLDPGCGEPIHLGNLSDGKEEIMRRLQHVPAPPYHDITPAQARAILPKDDSDVLHGGVCSVRIKAIATAVMGTRGRVEVNG